MTAKKKILAIPENQIVLQREVATLRNHFVIKTAPGFNYRRPITLVPCVVKILGGTLWADLTFSYFASTHAFLAVLFSRILRKKSVVIVGGYEVAAAPEIRYGLMLHPIGSRMVKFVLNHADKLLAVSQFNKMEISKYTKSQNITLAYGSNLIDLSKLTPSPDKEDLVIATTTFISHATIKRLGIETFIRAAQYMPSVNFALIGKPIDNSITHLKSIAPSNVTITGLVSEEEMLRWHQKAKVYCRLSYYDAFAVALVEAMACECVPVVTENGALAEIVGPTGFYVPYGDPVATAEAIKEALRSDKGKQARERIEGIFPMERLERELIMEIQELLET